MRILIDNVRSQAIVGGKDNLLSFDIIDKLRKYLRVRPKGYSQVPAYRKRHWDGWKYFITKRGYFATGFLQQVLSYLDELGVDIEVIDERWKDKKMSDLQFKKEPVWNMPNGWTLRDYQMDAVQSIDGTFVFQGVEYTWPRGIIDAATNSGKNSIIAGLKMNVVNPRILFLVHRKIIYQQAVEFFGMFNDLGEVRSGKFEFGDFTIAMAKTLANRADDSVNTRKQINNFNIVVVDETHVAGSKTFARLLQMVQAPMRVFVSGTPLDSEDKVHKMIIVGLSGTVQTRITNKQMIDSGVSLKAEVHIHLNRDFQPRKSYDIEYRNIVMLSPVRAALIYNVIKDRPDKQIVVAVKFKEHGSFLEECLQEQGVDVKFIHGQSKEQSEVIEQFKSGKLKVMVVTSFIQEGANIPNINVLVIAFAGKSKIEVKQFVGRVLRDDQTSDKVEVHDFYDVGHHLAKHSRKRTKYYKAPDEGFTVIEHFKTHRNKPVDFPIH